MDKEISKKIDRSILAVLIAGILTLITTSVSDLIQNKANLELERYKFESNLIITMIKTESPGQAAQNLKFLINSGLIKDEGGKISELILDESSIPFLSTHNSGISNHDN